MFYQIHLWEVMPMMKGKNGILSNFSNTDIAIEPKAKHQGVKKTSA